MADGDLAYALGLMEKYGTVDESLAVAQALSDEAKAALALWNHPLIRFNLAVTELYDPEDRDFLIRTIAFEAGEEPDEGNGGHGADPLRGGRIRRPMPQPRGDDTGGFYEDASRVLKSQAADWITISLADTSGQEIMNLLRLHGDAAAAVSNPAEIDAVVLQEQTVSTLGNEDLLLYLAAHGAKHDWPYLEWVADLAQLVARHVSVDWRGLLQRATAMRCRRIVLLSLWLAQETLVLELPAAMDQAWQLSLAGQNYYGAVDATFTQAQIACKKGHLQRAVEMCRRARAAISQVVRDPDRELPAVGCLDIAQGCVFLERNQLVEAERDPDSASS